MSGIELRRVGVTSNLQFSGSLVPSTNETYDLGDATHRWRSLHLAGSTIYLGDATIEAIPGGVSIQSGDNPPIEISANPVVRTYKIEATTADKWIDVSQAKLSNIGRIDLAGDFYQNGQLIDFQNMGGGGGGGGGITGTLAVADGGTGATSLSANKVLVGSGTDPVRAVTGLHWSDANGYLGIGTAAPAARLDVNGSIRASIITASNISTSNITASNISTSNLSTNSITASRIYAATGSIDMNGAVLSNVVIDGYGGGGGGNTTTVIRESVWSYAAPCNVYVIDCNVGVGIAEPSSIFHVNDTMEQSVLVSTINPYPPAALTANSTTLSSLAYGNGAYVCTASTVGGGAAYKAFNVSKLTDQWWMSTGNYVTSGGAYQGTQVTAADGANLHGEYLQIQMPDAIVLTSYALSPRQDTLYGTSNRSPRMWWLLGSVDGTTWNILDTQSNVQWTSFADKVYPVKTLMAYDHYRIVVNQVGNTGTSDNAFATIAEMQLTGALNEITYVGPPTFKVSVLEDPVFVVTNAGRVGIGSSLPEEMLVVTGNVKADAFLGSGALLTDLPMSGISGTLTVDRGGTGVESLSSGKLLVGNDTNAILQPNGLHWDVDNNRLGVGTTVPQEALDVFGNLRTRDITASNISGCNLRGTTLAAGTLTAGTLTASNLDTLILSASNLSACNIGGVAFTARTLDVMTLTASNLTASNLSVPFLSASNLSACNLSGDAFTARTLDVATGLTTSNLSATLLSTSNLSACNINTASLIARTMDSATLTAANLTTSNLLSTSNLSACNIIGAAFTARTLDVSLLSTSNLSASNVSTAALIASTIDTTALTAANLTTSNLISTSNLSTCNITAASLIASTLHATSLYASNLTTSNLLSTSNLSACNITAASFVASTLNATSLYVSSVSASNLISTSNLSACNVSTAALIASTIDTTALAAANLTTSNLLSTSNLSACNITVASLAANTLSAVSLSASNLTTSNLLSTSNLSACNVSTAALIASTINTTALTAANLTTSNLLSTSNLSACNVSTAALIASTINTTALTAVNLTTSNLVSTSNLSTCNITAASLVTSTLNATSLSASNLTTSNLLSTSNLSACNITTRSLVASDTITATLFAGSGASLTGVTYSNLGTIYISNGGTGLSTLSSGKFLVGPTSGSSVLQPTSIHWDESNARLGIGTSAPQQALDVQGAVNISVSNATNLICVNSNVPAARLPPAAGTFTEDSLYKTLVTISNAIYPPYYMLSGGSSQQTITGLYGSGSYTATVSSTGQNTNAEDVFDNQNTTYWQSATNYDANGVYTGSGGVSNVTQLVSASNIYGEWIQLASPSNFALTKYTVIGRTSGPRPDNWSLVGSTTSSNNSWTLIDSQTGKGLINSNTITLASPSAAYSYYRLITTKSSDNAVAIATLRLYGTATMSLLSSASATFSGQYYHNGTYTAYHDSPKINTSAIPHEYSNSNTIQYLLNSDSASNFSSDEVLTNAGDAATPVSIIVTYPAITSAYPLTSYAIQVGASTALTPRNWSVYSSADRNVWSLVDERSNITWTASQQQTFTFSNSVATSASQSTHVKWVFKRNNTATASNITLSRLYAYARAERQMFKVTPTSIYAPGTVVQEVATKINTATAVTSTSAVATAVTGSITPMYATSTLKVNINTQVRLQTTATGSISGSLLIYRDGAVDSTTVGGNNSQALVSMHALSNVSFLTTKVPLTTTVNANTVNATTFTVYAATNAFTTTMFVGSGSNEGRSEIIITEIAN